MILVFAMYAVLASTYIFAKRTVMFADPFFANAIRMSVAGIVLLGSQFIFNRKNFFIKRSDLTAFAAVAVFQCYITYTFGIWTLKYVSALKATLSFTLSPFIAALFSYFLLNERLTKNNIIGIILGMIGMATVIFIQSQNGAASGSLFNVTWYEFILLLCVISFTYSWFFVKKLRKKGYDASFINGVAMFAGGVMAFGTQLVVHGTANPVYNSSSFLLYVSLLIITSNLLYFNMHGYLIHWYSVTFLSFAGFLSPCFGTIYDWLFISGRLQWEYLVSLALITLGLYVFYYDKLKKVHA